MYGRIQMLGLKIGNTKFRIFEFETKMFAFQCPKFGFICFLDNLGLCHVFSSPTTSLQSDHTVSNQGVDSIKSGPPTTTPFTFKLRNLDVALV